MRITAITALAAFLLTRFRPSPGGTSERIVRLRLLTHNVFGQPESECKERMSMFGRRTARAEPAYDIVGVQEYFSTPDFGLRSCDEDYLRDAIEGPPAYRYRNDDNSWLFRPGSFWWANGGVGLFTLHPITVRKSWTWDDAPFQTRVQGFIFTRIRIPGTRVSVDVYVVHAHSSGEGCDRSCRESNMDQIADRIRAHSASSGNPVFVMGDFNINADPPGNAAYGVIMSALRNPRDLWREAHPMAPAQAGYTRDACGAITGPTCAGPDTGGSRIDYIFVVRDPDLTSSPYEVVIARSEDVQVVRWSETRDEYPFTRRVSDHFGVEATVEIRRRAEWEAAPRTR